MSELPNPAYWTDGDYGVSCTPAGTIYQSANPPWIGAKPLFTAEQVAELMERAAAYGDLYGHEEAALVSDFRAAYCKKDSPA